MVVAESEQGTTQTLERAITESASVEKQDVSEEPEVTEPEAEVEQADEGEKKADEKAPESKVKLTPELEAEVNKRAQSLKDRDLNAYREKLESANAYIKTSQDKWKETVTSKELKAVDRLGKFLLAEAEAQELSDDEIQSRKDAVEETKALAQKYAGVQEAAEVTSTMATKIPPNIVKEFGLDDPSPAARAKNGADLIVETVSVYKHNQNFLMALEHFLPKGDELRKQLETLVDGMAEFDSDKAKRLYIADKLRGVKVAPREKPPAPSAGSGGQDISKLSAHELLVRGFSKQNQGRK